MLSNHLIWTIDKLHFTFCLAILWLANAFTALLSCKVPVYRYSGECIWCISIEYVSSIFQVRIYQWLYLSYQRADLIEIFYRNLLSAKIFLGAIVLVQSYCLKKIKNEKKVSLLLFVDQFPKRFNLNDYWLASFWYSFLMLLLLSWWSLCLVTHSEHQALNLILQAKHRFSQFAVWVSCENQKILIFLLFKTFLGSLTLLYFTLL